MKVKKLGFDYIFVLKHLTVFLLFTAFNCLEKTPSVYSAAILSIAPVLNASPILTPLLFIASFLVTGSVGLLLPSAICGTFFLIVGCIYKKYRKKLSYEVALYTAASLLGYVFLGDTNNIVEIDKRLMVWLITTALSFICLISGKAVCEKGLKFKFGYEEFATLAAVAVAFGIGICNLFTPLVWKTATIFLILLIAYLYKTGTSALLSAVLGVSFALYYGNIAYISLCLVWSISAESLIKLSRYASAAAIVLADYIIHIIFNVYGAYTLYDLIFIVSGALIFCLIPTKLLKDLKEKLYSFREKQLARLSINRNRTMLAGRLYDLSGVFTEMANAFTLFKRSRLTEDGAKDAICLEINNICKSCDYKERCVSAKAKKDCIKKLIDIGFAKGKISLIDMPREIADSCSRPNDLIYAINKLLADYRAFILENMNYSNGRELIAEQSIGVAEILKGLALESGATLKYQSRIERALSDALFKQGYSVSELLIYGEDENLSVSMIITSVEVAISPLLSIISKTVEMNMTLAEKTDITEDKRYFLFRKAAAFDAVFGIARCIKDGSNKSGDTHSVTRIRDDKFLIALSDGMGSGEKAETVSSASLTLIESFYKAGLSSPLILNTVNKLLSINTEDSFTALDVSIIDLSNCTADFIKYGAPYGFIISADKVRIVEGNSLPLGILTELKPSVCQSALSDGDMLLLVTDGIADAFGSSGEIIDFLRTVPAKNPQTLADQMLERAIRLNHGIKKDDMTALTVRVYKRINELLA